MSDKEKTCEERISEHLESRLFHIRTVTELLETHGDREEMLELLSQQRIRDFIREDLDLALTPFDPDDLYNDIDEGRMNYGLSLDKKTVWTWQLSWGGPSDEFEIEVDAEGDVTEVFYLFKDWFDGARRRVTGSDLEAIESWIGPFVQPENY